jgi:hypothetical protein
MRFPFVNVVVLDKQVLPPTREELRNLLSDSKEAPLTAGPILHPGQDGPKRRQLERCQVALASFPAIRSETTLLNALAPALDKNDQHNDRKDSSNDSNNGYIVHAFSPF